jgi:hypothetical protein
VIGGDEARPTAGVVDELPVPRERKERVCLRTALKREAKSHSLQIRQIYAVRQGISAWIYGSNAMNEVDLRPLKATRGPLLPFSLKKRGDTLPEVSDTFSGLLSPATMSSVNKKGVKAQSFML